MVHITANFHGDPIDDFHLHAAVGEDAGTAEGFYPLLLGSRLFGYGQ